MTETQIETSTLVGIIIKIIIFVGLVIAVGLVYKSLVA